MDGTRALAAVVFEPLLPMPLFAALAVLAALAVGLALWRRARGAWLRAFVALVLVLALANPRLVQETRQGLTDIAVLLVDESASQRVGERRAQADAARIDRQAKGLEGGDPWDDMLRLSLNLSVK